MINRHAGCFIAWDSFRDDGRGRVQITWDVIRNRIFPHACRIKAWAAARMECARRPQ
jgi:hypothetical protein